MTVQSAAVPSQAYERVELAKQEWEVTLDALPQLICLIDEKGTILRANRTVERWNLGQVTELQEVQLPDLLHPGCNNEGCAVQIFLSTCQEDRQERSLEFEDPWLGRYIVIKAQPTTPRRRVVGQKTAIIIQDITQQKQAEESLHQTNEALLQALATKQEILQNVSHELRTPLTLIQGYASLLADDNMGHLTHEQKEAIAVITTQNQHLHNMIDRLILLQTLGETIMNKSACRLSSLIQQLLRDWHARAQEQGIHLLADENNDDCLAVLASPELLKEVINNLVENAIKFSPQGADVRILLRSTAQEVHIAVVDQGIGIAPQQQKQIFEHFYQVNGSSTRSVGGMGIGLALCQKIIRTHGGQLSVESAGEGAGSTFTVVLPRV